MDYEKLYREANKKVAVRFGSNVAKELFPDLYESKDERTRIYIINHLREHLKTVIEFLNNGMSAPFSSEEIEMLEASVAWLEKQGEQRPQGKSALEAAQEEKVDNQNSVKPAWGEEDECMLNNVIDTLKPLSQVTHSGYAINSMITWLKSLRPQNTWKPSEEMLEALYRAIPENVMEISEDEMLLDKLYQGLKYGRVLSKK